MLYISCSCLLALFQKLPKICKFREITVLKIDSSLYLHGHGHLSMTYYPHYPWFSLVKSTSVDKKWRCTVKVIQYGWNDVLTAACNLYPLNVSSWLFFHIFRVLSIITIHTRVCWAYECIGQSEAFRWVIAETMQFHVKWLTGWLNSALEIYFIINKCRCMNDLSRLFISV